METVKKIIYEKVNLKKARKEKGLSIRGLAELAKVNFGQIWRIENGMTMTEETWKKLKKALDKKI